MEHSVGLIVRLTAQEGRGDDLAAFLRRGASTVEDTEPGTVTWLAVRSDEVTFWIVDTFADDEARTAHIEGLVADAMKEEGPDLFAGHPEVIPTAVVATMPPRV